jgi:hypothetical protein
MKVIVSNVDGRIYSTDLKEPLHEMQQIVEGYIETVGNTINGIKMPDGFVMVVNEEGLLKELPLNYIGTAIYNGFGVSKKEFNPIVGRIFFVKIGYTDEGQDFVDCSSSELMAMEFFLKAIKCDLKQRGVKFEL